MNGPAGQPCGQPCGRLAAPRLGVAAIIAMAAAGTLLAVPAYGGAPAESAEESRVAFLVAGTSSRGGPSAGSPLADRAGETLGPEARAALELARREAGAVLVATDGAGRFWMAGDRTETDGVQTDGVQTGGLRTASLEAFRVVWIHEGNGEERLETLRTPASLDALRRHLEEGSALFLSGAAFAIVHDLGMETAVPRRLRGGNDRYAASIVPVEGDHPVFRGLEGRGVSLDAAMGGNPRESGVPLTDAGFPVSADFAGTGGPRGGRILARAASADENPLVEYAAGRGRAIALGWRLPHYALAPNAHRANLERLTANILRYLADPAEWRDAAPEASSDAPTPRPQAVSSAGGVPEEEWESLDLAVRDLIATHAERYPRGPSYLARLGALREAQAKDQAEAEALRSAGSGDTRRREVLDRIAADFRRLRDEALLDHPLLDLDGLLLVDRASGNLGLPANYHGNSDIPRTGYDNRIAVLSPVRPEGELRTVYESRGGRFLGDVDLHFDGDRILFSMPEGGIGPEVEAGPGPGAGPEAGEGPSAGSGPSAAAGPEAAGPWSIYELALDDLRPRKIPLIEEPDVDNFDACYLPDGRIVFSSTATFAGVPCVYGASHVTNLYLRGLDGSIRQLTVDQDHDWCPSILNDGRVLYLRWEYTDLPHSNSRILFRMNPDGTDQKEYYGTNSYFPNSFFYARPVPGHSTKVVGIATGHHGTARSGRLLILDPGVGHVEAGGVVQEIPGRGRRVPATIFDNLVDGVWPQFLHPYPLSETTILVAARPRPESPWGIYLVDIFDNRVLIKEAPGRALLEPIPLRRTRRPPTIPDRVDPSRRDAVVFLSDVYAGEGLRGIPRGTVKRLRLLSYHFAYRGMGGLLGSVGMDGPWDPKRVLGTVPVEPDGSAFFRVPANTPISVQPLDEDGRALQLMRSWFTAMPGEALSCVGCHERQEAAPPSRSALASRRSPSAIDPWYGPPRGFAFSREVQPVLDAHCVRCHDGRAAADFRRDRRIEDWRSGIAGSVSPSVGGKFSRAYAELHRLVRRPGIESDIHVLSPMDYHASATELVQMLEKGHGEVRLGPEDWDRIVTWIDLNAPYHGTWSEIAGEDAVRHAALRRREMSRRYAGVDEDPEAIVAAAATDAAVDVRMEVGMEVSIGAAIEPSTDASMDHSLPRSMDASYAPSAQRDLGTPLPRRSFDLAPGIALELVRLPPGACPLGDASGAPDERPVETVRIERPFWIGVTEVTNEQFALFDPSHDSHVESMHGYQFGIHGYPLDGPRQPVVRVSWREASAFCAWLSERTGWSFALPTEAQWEYACRAGTTTPFWYGGPDADWSRAANLGDRRLREFALDTYIRVRLVPTPGPYDDWVPRDDRHDDGGFVSLPVGSYAPSPWGLHDMHGNVAEWTRFAYRPYPYAADDGRNVADEGRDATDDGRNAAAPEEYRVVRGGSWYDRPWRCRASFRLPYKPYQRVFNVGFRVAAEE